MASPDDLLDASIQTLGYMIMALGLNIVVGLRRACSTSATSRSTRSAPSSSAGSGRSSSPTSPAGRGSTSSRARRARSERRPGIHINFFIVIFIAAAFTAHLGRDPRRPDAAAARRLPGDRDARVRRDRAARLRELHERHLRHRPHGLLQRPPGDHADRQDQPPVDDGDAQISTRAETRVLRRAGDGPARHLRQYPAARLAPRAGRGSRSARTRSRPRRWA